MLTEEIIKRIAAEESHHVVESGSPNAAQHNARAVEQAIRRALSELIDHFIDRASCACDNMEGTTSTELIQFETRMACAVETLELLGVKFDPITGKRS